MSKFKRTVSLLIVIILLVSFSVYAYEIFTKGLKLESTFTIKDDTFYKYKGEDGETVFIYQSEGYNSYRMLSIYDNDNKILYRNWEW